ncbi:MAG: amidohydrolase, partial [Proteobacteria bacterium]|nr:amidohydrolase [Pseudomonadota bacterium]
PPAPADASPLTSEEAAATRALVQAMDGSARLLIQGLVMPALSPAQSQLAQMERMAGELKVRAWKTYTNWGPQGGGWWLDDPGVGLPFIEKARRLGVKVIAVHKGLPFSGYDPRYSASRDVGAVARMYPDVNFVVYHAGFDHLAREGPYDPARAERGSNSLIKSLRDNGIAPNANVYVDLGATWRLLMRSPTLAAHTLGKLLKHVGEDRVVWGTDSIWWGSPQDQIQAFRAFQISQELQEKHGYAPITPKLRAQIFGLNAARPYNIDVGEVLKRARLDAVGRRRAEYQANPNPHFLTFGPKNRREFLANLKARGGSPI